MQYLASRSSNLFFGENPKFVVLSGAGAEEVIAEALAALDELHGPPRNPKPRIKPPRGSTLQRVYLLELEGEHRCYEFTGRPPEPKPEDLVWTHQVYDDDDLEDEDED